jgi:hypothetical protein
MGRDRAPSVYQNSAMILIIAEPFDRAALWLHNVLVKLGSCPVRYVTPSQLSYAPVIAQWLSTTHQDISISLSDGSVIKGDQILGVINRLIALPQAHLQRAAQGELAYAQSELYAFALGWLSTLACPVLNAPSPLALCGPDYPTIVSRHYAVSSGLKCSPETLTPDTADAPATPVIEPSVHVVFDGKVFGPILSGYDRDALIQFAQLWCARMVQIETQRLDGERHFVSATSLIDFPRSGTALVRAIAKALHG